MSRWLLAGLLLVGFGGSPQAGSSDGVRRLQAQARAHLSAGRCHDAELTLARLVRRHPASSEALLALRELGRLGRLRRARPAPDLASREAQPLARGLAAEVLLDKGLPLATVARSGSVTSDPELAVLLARTLAREPPRPVPEPATAPAAETPSRPPSVTPVSGPGDDRLERVLRELEAAERVLARGRATLQSRTPNGP